MGEQRRNLMDEIRSDGGKFQSQKLELANC